MKTTFECRCCLDLGDARALGLRGALDALVNTRDELVATSSRRRERTEELELWLEAADAEAARALAGSILADLLRGAHGEDGRIRPGPLAVEPTAPPLTDPYGDMGRACTNAHNFELPTEALIEQFRAWESRVAFDVVEVGGANVTLRFRALPRDLEAFVLEAYAFCPDLAEDVPELAGLESLGESEFDRRAVIEIARQLRERRLLRFWWG